MPCFWRPLAPCPIVPAKKTPGQARALPPGRLGRQPARPERRDPERGQVEQRADEPGRGDHLVGLDREVGAAVGPAEADAERATGQPLDPVERRIEDAHAAAQDVVLERLDIAGADPDERLGVDRQAGRRWRGEDELARPGQEAVGELEARVLLADDEDPLVRVLGGGLDVGVVVGVLEALARWDERLGHAHRDDQDPAGVRAVRRLDA